MDTKVKFNSQVCTSRSQSERLLALGLKKETADMVWTHAYYSTWAATAKENPLYFHEADEDTIPAWSLHRLLCMLPRCVEGGYHLAISYDHIEYRTTYNEVTTWWRGGGNTYDMIIETIEWLIKEGYFNKEYLV